MRTEENRTITVNPLPAKTWNWLHMNQTVLQGVSVLQDVETAEKEFIILEPDRNDHGQEQEAGCGKDAGAEETQAVKTEQTCQELESQNWEIIETGMGKELEQLCTENCQRIRYVEIPAAEKMEDPLILAYGNEEETGNRYEKLCIHAGADGSASVIIVAKHSPGEDRAAEAQKVLQVKIIAEKNASVNLYLVQLLEENIICLHDVGSTLAAGAHVNVQQLELGAKEAYAGVCFDLSGEKSTAELASGYYGCGSQKLDYNYIARHRGRKTVSNMAISGVLKDTSEKLMRGTIDFIHGCSGAKGDEKEEVLLIGDDMVNRTIPLILCAEEDVEGNHGASIGKLDETVLFYAATRGITPERAEELLARAKIEAVSSKIPSEEVREEIGTFLDGHKAGKQEKDRCEDDDRL